MTVAQARMTAGSGPLLSRGKRRGWMVTVAQATSVVSPGDADKDTPVSGLFRAVGISRAEVQSQEPTRGLHLPQ